MSNSYLQTGINGPAVEEEIKFLREQVDELQSLRKKDINWLKGELEKIHNNLEILCEESTTSRKNLKVSFCSEIGLLNSTPVATDTESSSSTHDEAQEVQERFDDEETQRTSNSETNRGVQQGKKQHLQNSKQQQSFGDVLGPIPDHSELQSQSMEFAAIELSDHKESVQHESSLNDRFINMSNVVGDRGEEENLETDIYSILMISSACTLPFFYAMMVACCQFFITILILIDLLVDDRVVGVRDDNPLNVPSKVEWPVVCAQFLALIIAFVTVDDMITSMKMFIVGYDPDLHNQHPGATYCKFVFSNLIRFLEGMCTIFVSVVIIVVSSNVLEIFMNFVTVAFVSTLDNLAFQLAQDGLCGERLSMACKNVLETKVKVQRKIKFSWVINLLFIVIFLPFLSVLTAITIRQNSGYILATTTCKNLDVHFGEEMYTFPADVIYIFEGSGNNKTFPNSKRVLPFFPPKANPLLYQYFSGHYEAETLDNRLQEFNARPIYWERGIKDPTSGKFYYCDAIKSWVFTIEALYDTCGAIPEESRKECEWGWLLQSPVTDAITLDEAPKTNWNIWTGDMQVAREFSVTCTDCDRNSDCGLTHGTCDRESGTCMCNDKRQGRRCNVEKPYCQALVWLHYGESSNDYFEERLYTLATKQDGTLFTFYDRPVYGRPISLSEVELIAYGGNRWLLATLSWDEISVLREIDDLNGYDIFHGYWSNAFDNFIVFYSDPTSNHIPIGLKWHRVQESKATGTFGIFGATYEVNARFECLDNKCMDNQMCGNFGECVTGIERGLVLNELGQGEIKEIEYRHCKCRDYYGGFFCENRPDGPYSSSMYNEYMADPVKYVERHLDMDYLKFWV